MRKKREDVLGFMFKEEKKEKGLDTLGFITCDAQKETKQSRRYVLERR